MKSFNIFKFIFQVIFLLILKMFDFMIIYGFISTNFPNVGLSIFFNKILASPRCYNQAVAHSNREAYTVDYSCLVTKNSLYGASFLRDDT